MSKLIQLNSTDCKNRKFSVFLNKILKRSCNFANGHMYHNIRSQLSVYFPLTLFRLTYFGIRDQGKMFKKHFFQMLVNIAL